jgi:hypothetical protein
MNRLWQALEQICGLSTSRVCWQQYLEDEDLGRYELLAATSQLAQILPVIGNTYEWLEVSEFEEGVFEGYNEKREEYVPVNRSDLVCYEFSVPKLTNVLSNLVGFTSTVERLNAIHHCYLLGQFGGTLGAGFAFYFFKESTPQCLARCLDDVQLKDQRPYVLFLTSMRVLGTQGSRMLNDKGCLVLPLDQSLIHDEGGWGLADWARKKLVDFRDRFLPKPQAAVGKFPTPSGCSWTNVEIRFLDSHTVTVIAGGHRARLMYSQMGLANSKNGLPNMQWELLVALAHNHGVMTWNSPGARRENRKHRESLNRRLREFFGIDGDPIELTEDSKGYRCVFRLVPDDSREYARLAIERDD